MAINQSNLPSIQRLKWEDFSREETWQEGMQALIAMMNLFVTPVYDILNGGVTLQNLESPRVIVKTITGATITTFSFTNPLRVPPTSVVVGNVWLGIPSVHPSTPVQAFWHVTNNQIIIDDVTGLTPGMIYNLTLLVS